MRFETVPGLQAQVDWGFFENYHVFEKGEKKNIDLLIFDKNNVVVIENKIKSSINGINERHDIYSNQVQSQLKKTINLLQLMMSIARKL